MIRSSLLLLLIAFSFSLMGQGKEKKAINEVMEIIEIQKDAWNKGDINGFMAHYWNSPELKFVSTQGVRKGWDDTLQRYIESYPDEEAMGQLRFEIITTNLIAKKTVTMTGKYILLVKGQNLEGYFLLVWQKKNGKWVIISDATN